MLSITPSECYPEVAALDPSGQAEGTPRARARGASANGRRARSHSRTRCGSPSSCPGSTPWTAGSPLSSRQRRGATGEKSRPQTSASSSSRCFRQAASSHVGSRKFHAPTI